MTLTIVNTFEDGEWFLSIYDPAITFTFLDNTLHHRRHYAFLFGTIAGDARGARYFLLPRSMTTSKRKTSRRTTQTFKSPKG